MRLALPASRGARDWLVLAGAATLALVVLGLLTRSPTYLAGAGLTMALFALFALGLQLQFGHAGLINFGHVASAALGAYGLGLAARAGLGWVEGALLGAGLAVGFAVLVGLPTLRLREDYLAIVTIGAAEMLRILLTSEVWLTAGPLGIYGFPRPGLAWALDPSGPWVALAGALGVRQPYLLLLLALTLLALALSYALFHVLAASPWGRALRAVRDDEDVAAALGKDPFRLKLQALALGALPAASYGMLFAWFTAQIVPDNFLPIITFYAWIIVVLGGAGVLRGALVGSVALWGLFFFAQVADFSAIPLVGGALAVLSRPGPGQLLLIGLLLVAFMMHRPQGVLGRQEEMRFGR